MTRSTHKDERGYYLAGDGIYVDDGDPAMFRGADVDRLAAYEDTGLEPEEIAAHIETAAPLSVLQAENEKLRAGLERKNEALDFSRTTDAEAVRLAADLARVTSERDALIKRTARDCWSCIRRYECNNRKGPHKRCWEFDPWLLKEG